MIARIVLVSMAVLIMGLGCSKEGDKPKSAAAPANKDFKAPGEPESVTQELQDTAKKEPAKETATTTTQQKPAETAAEQKEEAVKQESKLNLPPGLYAVLETSMGNITIKLYEKEAPETVANFVGLATGTKPYTDPKTGQETKGNFYDGLIFHRVIPSFMIQGGCPLGKGTGDPGYKFADEFSDNLKFDGPGYLAMANSGPNTNGSQFFITVAPTEHLNNKHTIFGKVVDGQDVANAISEVKTDGPRTNRPVEPVMIKHVKIQRVDAKK